MRKDRFNSPSNIIMLLGAVVVLAIGIRIFSIANFINPEGGFYFYSIDAHDHLRRITLGVHTFPSIPGIDYYVGFPKGTGQLWSPLYDYILSAIALCFGGSSQAIETIGFFANPIYAALTVIFIYFVAAKTFSSTPAGIAAAFLLAVFPGYISYTVPMNFDHHVFEPLAVLLLFSLIFLERNGRLSLKAILYAIISLILAIFMWRGATLYWGMLFLSVFLRVLLYNQRRLSLDYAVVYTGSALIVSTICFINPWGNANSVSFGIISWFHAIVLAIAAVILFLLGLCNSFKKFVTLSILFLIVSSCILLFWQPGKAFLAQIINGITFIRGGTGDPWLESNREMKGIFTFGNFWFSATYLSLLWFITPCIILFASKNWYKSGRRDAFLINFIIWSPLVLLGFILRYVPIAGIITALAGGYLFAITWQRFRLPLQHVTISCLLLSSMLPSYQHYKLTLENEIPPYIKDGLLGQHGALTWIRQHTPNTSYYLNASRQPEYGILTDWDLGARIYQLAQRPALATAFGWETHGFYEQALFWSTDSPELAIQILQENKIKYILAAGFKKLSSDYSITLDGEKKGKIAPGIIDNFRPNFSMYKKLMYFDGSTHKIGNTLVRGLGRYRLLFETDYLMDNNNPRSLSYYKLFEFVPGAVITGKTNPDSVVSVRLSLRSSRGRLFYYYDQTISEHDGSFLFRVPYATDSHQKNGTQALGNYLVTLQNMQEFKVTVAESDIQQGNTILLDAQR